MNHTYRHAALALTLLFLLIGQGVRAEEAPLPVITQPIARQTLAEPLTAWGSVAESSETLHFATDGLLQTIAVRDGERVVSGQPLAQLDAVLAQNQRDQAHVALRFSEKALERTRKLHAKGIVGDDQLDNASQDQALKELTLGAAEERLQRHTLRAPAAGQILRRLVDQPGPVAISTPIAVFKADSAPWRASVALAGRHLSQLALGTPVEVSVEGLAAPLAGKVERISGVAESGSGLFMVDIALTDAPTELRSGLQVRARFTLREAQGYAVPLSAFYRLEEARGLLFLTGSDGLAHRVEVQVGAFVGNAALVTTDLSAFEAVITQGQQHLKDGARVVPR